jgi:ribulose-5-phosphate 4-epimerase/fuculose-1-phosphate aldolase
MISQIEKFETRLIKQNLAQDREMIAICGLDDTIVRSGPFGGDVLDSVLGSINILGLVSFVPHPLYKEIIRLTARRVSVISPEDCETRTFLHDVPVIADHAPGRIIKALSRRKGAVFRDGSVIARGVVTIEEAFVCASSVIHALFINYFLDYWRKIRKGRVTASDRSHFENIVENLFPIVESGPRLGYGPFDSESVILKEMVRAGKATVETGLVDSFFGNISYSQKGTCHISETGASLDELEGAIVGVPMNGSSSVGLTASSELGAHIGVVDKTGCRSIMHGHPKFSVIASMMCEEDGVCQYDCYKTCPRMRDLYGVPIVSGEIGAGGLAKTLPARIKMDNGAIVYGHGVFATGSNDFRKPFNKMVEIERMARRFVLTECARARN